MSITKTNADKALAAMKADGKTTSSMLRSMGIKKPSAAIAKLRARGLRVQSQIINTKHGRKMAVYTLETHKAGQVKKQVKKQTRRKTQVESVLEYLQAHRRISCAEAWNIFHVASLRSVIRKIRSRGYLVRTDTASRDLGAMYTRYWFLGKAEEGKPEVKRKRKVSQENRVPQVLKITHKTSGWWKRR